MFMNKRVSILFLIIVTVAGFAGCQSGSAPGLRQGRSWIEQHFANDLYKGLVNVVDVELVDAVEENYEGGLYRNLKLLATIDVKEDYVVSRLFTYNSFEVSEQWPRNFEAQMAAAQSDEERERIKNTFDSHAFSKGQHEISVYVEYIFMEDDWKVFSSSISAMDLNENTMMPS